jgi:hypothetical protein
MTIAGAYVVCGLLAGIIALWGGGLLSILIERRELRRGRDQG